MFLISPRTSRKKPLTDLPFLGVLTSDMGVLYQAAGFNKSIKVNTIDYSVKGCGNKI
jgi:hypothetical protein